MVASICHPSLTVASSCLVDVVAVVRCNNQKVAVSIHYLDGQNSSEDEPLLK